LSPTASTFATPFSLEETTIIKSRTLSSTGEWSALTQSVFTVPLDGLAVTEIMYHPAADGGSLFEDEMFEFLEFHNVGTTPINLAKIQITDGIDFKFVDGDITTLAPGAFALVVASREAFESRYGEGLPIAGEYTGSLNNAGEQLTVSSVFGPSLISFSYSDEWYPHTDGEGYSLTRLDPTNTAADASNSAAWRPSNRSGGSPGTLDAAVAPGSIVVNEVFANSVGSADGDWIELFNTTSTAVDISHWFLSDTTLERGRFQFAAGTVIPALSYFVVTENGHFGTASTHPGRLTPFNLNPHGDSVVLTGADLAGNELGYRDDQTFEASEPGVSIGRFIKSSGGSDFVRLVSATRDGANSTPRVGPLVINEIMYHPAGTGAEYVEIHNTSSSAVSLDDGNGRSWRLRGAFDFSFPAGHSIPAGGYALVIQGLLGANASAEAAAFRASRNVPVAVPIFVYNDLEHGTLDNVGEKIYLEKPLEGTTSLSAYVLIDAVKYDDEAPWPTLPDGDGPSLAKINSVLYGNDVNVWSTGSVGGTPGTVNSYIDTTPPGVPANVSARILSPTQVRLRWTESDDPQSGISEYRIYRNNALVGTSKLGVFTDVVTLSTTPLAYQIAAVNRDGFESTRTTAINVGGENISFQDGIAGYTGTRDATIRQPAPTSATGTTATTLEIDGDDAGGDLAAVLKWQLSGIPAGAIVVAASIGVNVVDPASSGYPIYVLRRDWVEGEVTWERASAANVWGQSGATATTDRDAVPIGNTSSATGLYEFNAAGIAAVQAWLNGTAQNYGVIIADTTLTDGLDLSSRESANVASHPKLTISYLLPITPPVPGDLNESGIVDAADIDFLRRGIALGSVDKVFDVNGDSAVNAADVDHLVRNILQTEYGDLNLDREVNRADAALLARHFGAASGGTWATGDINGDGRTTLVDVAMLQGRFGFESAGSPAAQSAAVTATARRVARPALDVRAVERAFHDDARESSADQSRRLNAMDASTRARRSSLHRAIARSQLGADL
jgi:hypothetical protein